MSPAEPAAKKPKKVEKEEEPKGETKAAAPTHTEEELKAWKEYYESYAVYNQQQAAYQAAVDQQLADSYELANQAMKACQKVEQKKKKRDAERAASYSNQRELEEKLSRKRKAVSH
eukprot:TRINITY_DN7721_c3_g1_i3.p1 TRINITY_DN7721_c3_g1~~TRINITY_DN7721_c3_g1_i3.p1  ORF type:complete len:116 (+),score=30.24 TRINITY_DN7721_c3_g1_i3:146-493(+)